MPTSEIGEDTNSETYLGEVGVVLTNKSKSEILNTTGGSSSAGFECERAYDVDNCMIEKAVGRDGETMFKLHLQKFNSDAELLTLLCKLDWESEDYLVAVDAFKNQIQGPMELMQTVHCKIGSTNIGFNINQVESIQDLKKQAVTKADDAIGEWGIFLRTLEKYAESKEWKGSYTQLRAIKGGKRTRFRCEINGLPMSNWDRLVGQSVRFDSNNHGERYRAFAEVIQRDPEVGTADFEILGNENDVRVINGLGNLGSISYQDIGTVEECRRQRNAIDRLLKGESKSKGWLKDFLFSASKPVGIKSEAVQKQDQIANFLEPRLNQVQ
ncbi:MAG: hypothetical protein VXX29_01840, partial [Verrucomicrobiota bacterium]|nr:hypothetical protein [Verrucomicrobiota bacterium]